MRAIDTNILVYAQIRSTPQHKVASELLRELAEGGLPWAIPWPCVYEFLRVVTHPRVFHPPVSVQAALNNLSRIVASPTVVLLHETSNHPQVMLRVLNESGVSGNLIHDAHIAALCVEHGISELITADRDFSRFSSINTLNPFV